MDALQLGAETAKKERRAPEQKKVAAVAALQLFKSLLYFSRPGQVQPADISEASCQATMCFPGLRGLCQAFRGDLRWMKEAQASASPATFFAFPTCTSAGDPLGLELAGESVSSQKNPSFCGILRVVRLGLRVVTANHPLTIYMQLSTQNRADDFDQNQCEAIAAAVGGFARELTYEYALCKFVLEVSVSLIADKIQERLGQNRASRVLPRCCNSG